MGEPGLVTSLLKQMREGDPSASERLMQLVYGDLRSIAARSIRRGRAPTLCPTALVNECFLRLFGQRDVEWQDRRHFFSLAANVMRDIVVERARRAAARKRGGGWTRLSLEATEISVTNQHAQVLALDEALRRLQERAPFTAQVVMLRYFGGLTVEQTARALDVPVIRVRREWQYARAVLHRDIYPETAGPSDV